MEREPASPLRLGLDRAVETCEQTLETLRAAEPGLTRSRFAATLMLAIAAFQTVLEQNDDADRRGQSLLIAGTLGRDAAAVIRQHGLDDQFLRCAEACDTAATLCETALRKPPRR